MRLVRATIPIRTVPRFELPGSKMPDIRAFWTPEPESWDECWPHPDSSGVEFASKETAGDGGITNSDPVWLNHDQCSGFQSFSKRFESRHNCMRSLLGAAFRSPEKEHARLGLTREGGQVTEIGVCGDDDTIILSRSGQHLLVGAPTEIDGEDVQGVVTLFGEEVGELI